MLNEYDGVQHDYCSDGRIPGAEKIGRVWLIPKDAEKPKDKRRREIKESAR